MIKGHVHKMVGHWLAEFTDLREWLNHNGGAPKTADVLVPWVNELIGRINLVFRKEREDAADSEKSPRAIAREQAEEAKAAAVAEQAREDAAFEGSFFRVADAFRDCARPRVFARTLVRRVMTHSDRDIRHSG